MDNNAKLDDWIIPSTRTEKLELLDKLRDKEQLSWIFYSFENQDSLCIENLHFVDFDCDGIRDLIYYGFVGGESNRFVFFKGLSDGSYSDLIGVWGRLIEISDNDEFTPLSFTIYNYACCAGVINHIERYVSVWNDSKFGYELQSKYSMYYNVDMPKTRFKKPIGFKTINDKYYLRLNPYINDTIILDHDEEGNIFAEYPKDSEGFAIAEQTDETGRIWWFVIMKNNIKPIWDLYVNGDNNEEPSYYLSWISSRFVQRIE
ncbi:MAG: hypothetical protein JXA68_10745 [Ignavibacteriales bacterium]|nr:hypothetical protein [Ignavibacteriales bacterium]